jgi:hypothetical protein
VFQLGVSSDVRVVFSAWTDWGIFLPFVGRTGEAENAPHKSYVTHMNRIMCLVKSQYKLLEIDVEREIERESCIYIYI